MIKKIYVHEWYTRFIPVTEYTVFKEISEVPNDCDIVAISFFDSAHHKHNEIIDSLLKKTKRLLVNVSEPTSKMLFKFCKQYPNVYFFGDAIFNFEVKNWETIVSWFITSENYYATPGRVWPTNLLSRLVPNDVKQPTKMFDCLLGGSNGGKPHRDQIEQLYLASACRDKFIFSYFRDYLQSQNRGLWTNEYGNIDDRLNVWIDNEIINLAAVIPVDIYNDSWYSIVAETTCYNLHNQYTEKVAKPIVSRRPFVAFAGQHYLKNLKKLGFQTFATVIDESYDSIENLDSRVKAAWEQVEWLCKQDPLKVCQELAPILEHNRQHFLCTDWQSAIKKYF